MCLHRASNLQLQQQVAMIDNIANGLRAMEFAEDGWPHMYVARSA